MTSTRPSQPRIRSLVTLLRLAGVAWTVLSCGDHDIHKRAIVYTGGYTGPVSHEIATYWADQKEIRVGDTTERSTIRTLFVQGNDVYAGGYESEHDPANNQVRVCAAYWKNDKKVILLDPQAGYSGASVHALYVTDSDVHALGTATLSSFTAHYYWKNGEIVMANFKNQYSAITAAHGNIYITGAIDGKAAYWENDVPHILENGTLAQSISIDGNDIYVLGYEQTYGEDNFPIIIYKYWKNGAETVIGKSREGNQDRIYKKIVATAGDVYICGNETFSAGTIADIRSYASYWKNGNITHLNDGVEWSTAVDMAAAGGDIYSAVSEDNGSTHKPVTWLYKNQTAIRLSDPSYRSRPTCLFVP